MYPSHHLAKNPPCCPCSFQLSRRVLRVWSVELRFWLVKLSKRLDAPWPVERLLSPMLGGLLLKLAELEDISDESEPRLSEVAVAAVVVGIEGRR